MKVNKVMNVALELSSDQFENCIMTLKANANNVHKHMQLSKLKDVKFKYLAW